MEHRWMKLFDAEGNWTRPERKIKVNGVEHDLDEYAKEHGIELPSGPTAPNKPKKSNKINIDIEDKHEDLDESHGSADSEVDGDGDSEG